jgi:hypothetical protein
MAYIGQNPIDAFRGLASYDTFTGDGSTTTFDLSQVAPDGGQNDITVVVNNVIQEPGVSKSYTLGVDDNGNYKRVTFNTAPEAADEIYVINPGRTTSVLQVTNNSIITSMLQDDVVTTAKIDDSAITTAKINDSAITTAKILDGTITAGDLNATLDLSSKTITLPASVSGLGTGITNAQLAGSIANNKLANSSITINGTSISLGSSGTIVAGTSWQTVKTSGFTAIAGEGYFCNTTSAAFTATLPASATRGDEVSFIDYAGTFDTNNLTIGRNSHKIQGASEDLTVSTERAGFTLVYVDSTQGWLLKNK